MTWKEPFTVTLDARIRPCRREDLPALEWFGLFRKHRELFESVWLQQERGEAVMLVLEANHAPVGQLWIDLIKAKAARTGILWAMRILPCLQNLGLGSRLLGAGEQILRCRKFAYAELSVEPDNFGAQRFYGRLGYSPVPETSISIFPDPEAAPNRQIVMRKNLFPLAAHKTLDSDRTYENQPARDRNTMDHRRC